MQAHELIGLDATDLSQEMDLGKYSGTKLVDKTLYNIRRERVTELFSEGLRFADLDQAIAGAY